MLDWSFCDLNYIWYNQVYSYQTLLLIDDLQEDSFDNYSQLPLSTNCQIIATTRLKLSNSSIKFLEIDFLDFDSAKLPFPVCSILSTTILIFELSSK